MTATIRTVYSETPTFPATDQHPSAARYVVGGYVVDAIGGEPTLAQVQEAIGLGPPSHSAVDVERDRRLKTFTFQGHVFDFLDGKSDANISGAATLALGAIMTGKQPGDLRWADPNTDFAWIAHDNATVTLDAQTTFALGQAAAAWKSAHIFAGRAIKNLSPIPADYADNARWPT